MATKDLALLDKIQSFLGPVALSTGTQLHVPGQRGPSPVTGASHSSRLTKDSPGTKDSAAAVAPRRSLQHITPSDLYLLSDCSRPGFFVRDEFLKPDEAKGAAADGLALQRSGGLRPAGMSRGEGKWADSSYRGDVMAWMSELDLSLRPGLQRVVSRLHELRDELDELDKSSGHLLRLDRTRTSIQVAYYAGDGKGYVRHRDAFPEDDDTPIRCVTMICYLNDEGWEASAGGRLRLFLDAQDGCPPVWEVDPTLGKLVVFRSDVVEHEVLPAFKPRLAVTCWCYGRPVRSRPKPLSSASIKRPLMPSGTMAEPRPLPLKAAKDTEAETALIFVSIVSYRDPECPHTLLDLFQTAKHPDRVRVGLVLQQAAGDEQDEAFSASPLPEQWAKHVRTLTLDYREAAGPCWARHLAQALWCGEEYFLQLDSHMRFRRNWDAYLIETLSACPSAMPVLTTYPIGYHLPNIRPREERPTVLCPKEFNEKGILRQTARLCSAIQPEPLPSPLWAAGFSFSRSSVIEDVPYDPFLRHLFFGEEISMAARLWTHGYDFFAPPETVIFHLWSRGHRPSFREVADAERTRQEATSLCRVKQLLGCGDEAVQPRHLGRYGLGSRRPLQQFEAFVGVDFARASLMTANAPWTSRDPGFYVGAAVDEQADLGEGGPGQLVLRLLGELGA